MFTVQTAAGREGIAHTPEPCTVGILAHVDTYAHETSKLVSHAQICVHMDAAGGELGKVVFEVQSPESHPPPKLGNSESCHSKNI